MKIKFTDPEGNIHQAESQNLAGKVWIHFQGHTFVYESENKAGRAKTAGKAKSGNLLAPMPGKVTKIIKEPGDIVKVGDVILVMEAMKMEYTLKSEVTGILEKLNCQSGEQVTLGKLLAQIKENG